MPDFDKKPWSDLLPFLREEVLPILAIAVAAIIAFRLTRLFVHGIVKTLLDREATEGTAQELSAVELKKRMDTLDALGANTLRFFIVIIAGLMILGTIGLDIGPAVAGLGVVGIAVGFGAQFLVRDYLNGSLILIENQFGRGDVVRVAGVSGTVEDFTLRRTTLRDIDGVVHTVPNGEIKVASNLTRVWARINQDVTVVYGTDIDKVDRGRRQRRPRDGRRPRLEAPRPRGTPGRARPGPGRERHHPQDPGHGPGRRPVECRRRLPQAPAGRLPRARYRDAPAAAGRPDPQRQQRPARRTSARTTRTSPPIPTDRRRRRCPRRAVG